MNTSNKKCLDTYIFFNELGQIVEGKKICSKKKQKLILYTIITNITINERLNPIIIELFHKLLCEYYVENKHAYYMQFTEEDPAVGFNSLLEKHKIILKKIYDYIDPDNTVELPTVEQITEALTKRYKNDALTIENIKELFQDKLKVNVNNNIFQILINISKDNLILKHMDKTYLQALTIDLPKIIEAIVSSYKLLVKLKKTDKHNKLLFNDFIYTIVVVGLIIVEII